MSDYDVCWVGKEGEGERVMGMIREIELRVWKRLGFLFVCAG